MSPSNRSRYTVLACLSVRPMSGYDIKRFLEDTVVHFWSESFGQIYPSLKALEAEGAVIGRDEEGDGGRPRRVYTLTEAGLSELRTWLAEPPAPVVPRYEISLKLFFGDQMSLETALEHLRAHRERHATLLAQYRGYEAHVQGELEASRTSTVREATDGAAATGTGGRPALPHRLAVLRGGIRYSETVVRWCEETIDALESLDATAYPAEPSAPVEACSKRSQAGL